MSKSSRGLKQAVVLLGVVIVAYFAFTPKHDSWKPSPLPAHSPAEAWDYCSRAVKKSLRAPASAEFPSWIAGGASESTYHLGGGTYRVSSYVDAQNAFGAKVRTAFNCTVEYRDGDWSLVDLALEE